MRLYVISSDEDTVTGLRLAGVEGETAENAAAAESAIARTAADGQIGILLINRELMASCGDFVQEFRKKHSLPLLVEIPDTGGRKSSDSIARYVREAVGIKE